MREPSKHDITWRYNGQGTWLASATQAKNGQMERLPPWTGNFLQPVYGLKNESFETHGGEGGWKTSGGAGVLSLSIRYSNNTGLALIGA